MWRCPVCEKEQIQGSICDGCGFDTSCDYESHRTLYSTPPKQVEPISARAAKWKRQQKQTNTVAQGTLVCSKCGGKDFSLLIDELQLMCTDCGMKTPITIPKNALVSENNRPVEHETACAPDDPPVINSNPQETDTAPAQVLRRINGSAIATRYRHTVGLKADGTVVAVGSNGYGQCHYTGDVSSGKPNGTGTVTYDDGSKYEGEWKDGERDGAGTFTWSSGAKYVGAWTDGMRSGTGTMTWADGTKYVGAWKDDKRNGTGTMTYSDGAKYVGAWKDDKRNGTGTYTWPNGNKYEGGWKDDKRNGTGTMTYANGAKRAGLWKDDEFVSD